MKPWNYQPGKKYPIAFLVHGGPQGSFGNGWSYRWNPQVYAGAGYATVFIDFHGSTGYGQKFTDAISGDWGGKPLEDLKKGLAAAVGKYCLAGPLARLRAGRVVRRLHDELDRGELVRRLQVHRQPRRRVRHPRHGLLDRGTVVHRVGKRRRPLLRDAGQARAIQPGAAS